MDKKNFAEFKDVGVLASDTFETWRQKTNGIVETLDTINTGYADKSQVLRLDNTAQAVGSNKSFNGITIVGTGLSFVSLTVNSSSELQIDNSVYVGTDKSVSANLLEARSGKIKANGKEYTWPAAPNQGDGYIYHNNGNLQFQSVTNVANAVIEIIGDEQLVSPAQEINPVGTIIALKRTTAPNNTWLECNGGTIPLDGGLAASDPLSSYHDLYVLLGNTTTLPNLSNKVLVGATGATGNVGSASPTGASLYEVRYYIKAKKDAVANFTITSGNGVSLTGQGGSTQLNIYGGSISLKVGSEFIFDASKNLIIKTNSIDYDKLKNATTSVSTGEINIPLRDANGYIRGNTPGISASGDGAVLVNKAYADSIGQTKEHKVRTLNGKGYNSYSVQPDAGCVFVTYDSRAKAYGLTNRVYYGQRYGSDVTQSYGYTLPRFDKDVKKVYTDTYNTYVLYSDDTVDAYGHNTDRKSGSTLSTATATRLSAPTQAFNGDAIDEVILSYDTNAQTTYALNKSGKLWVAGSNLYGQLGLNSSETATSNTYLPRLSAVGELETVGGKTITKAWLIGGGATQTGYALVNDGTLWACGYGNYGQTGRRTANSVNRSWLPILSGESSTYVGGTTTYVSGTGVYTSTNNHELRNYDVVIDAASNRYSVKYLTDKTFALYTVDDLSSGLRTSTTPISFGSCSIYKRMTAISNAYFGGTGSQTFGFVKTTDGTLYSWGYNTYGQLGIGSAAATVSSLTPVLATVGSSVKASDVYTGLDNTVHFVGTNGLLYACGSNEKGALGTAKTVVLGSKETQFQRIEVSMLDQSGLSIPIGTTYTVYRFFSVGPNTRFCVFNSVASSIKKLAAWGDNTNNKLGTGGTASAYNKPQAVYCERDQYVYDVQSTQIFGANSIVTLMINDADQSYGDLFTCGYHSYNIAGVPDSTVPFITKVKNI